MKSKSECGHKNQERIDYATNICRDCGRLISTIVINAKDKERYDKWGGI